MELRYIDYLLPFASHLFRNKQLGQQNERKYIGVVLEVNGMKYFAPLSSYKLKHEKVQWNYINKRFGMEIKQHLPKDVMIFCFWRKSVNNLSKIW